MGDRVGIDLGGTKIEGIVLAENGSITAKERVATPQDDYDGTIKAIVDLVERLDASKSCTVGVGTPGTVESDRQVMKNCNSTWLNGKPLPKDLSEALGREIRIANDANCFALSEATDGAAARGNVVFGAILGTGCGGGIVVNKQVLTGPNGLAGEWGHNPMSGLQKSEEIPERCYCKRFNCVELFLSGPGIAADYERVTGESMTPEGVVEQAADGNHAEAALRRFEHRLARALGGVINTLDPDVIVVGGGLSKLKRIYKNVPALWREFVFGGGFVKTKLVPPKHGDASGVRGAARLWEAGS